MQQTMVAVNFIEFECLIRRTQLVTDTYNETFFSERRTKRERKHMMLNNINFYWVERVNLLCICKRQSRMYISVKTRTSFLFMPVVQIIIMQECTAYH